MAPPQQMIIEVKGEADIQELAERALVKLAVTMDDSSRAKVTDTVFASARTVEAMLYRLSASEGSVPIVDYWSRSSPTEAKSFPTSRVGSFSSNRRGLRARVDFDVCIQRFDKLGSFIRDLVQIEHVEIQAVEWILTPESLDVQRSKLRNMAAQNAHRKAKEYAAALHYGRVVGVELREMPAAPPSSVAAAAKVGVPLQEKTMLDAEGWEEVDEEAFRYQPEVVKMALTVDVKFSADFPF